MGSDGGNRKMRVNPKFVLNRPQVKKQVLQNKEMQNTVFKAVEEARGARSSVRVYKSGSNASRAIVYIAPWQNSPAGAAAAASVAGRVRV